MHRPFFFSISRNAARGNDRPIKKKAIDLSEKGGLAALQNIRLDKRREDALKGNVPHITHDNNPTYAHQKCHQEVDSIIVQQTKPTLDVSACLTIKFLVMCPRANRHLIYTHKVSLICHIGNGKVAK